MTESFRIVRVDDTSALELAGLRLRLLGAEQKLADLGFVENDEGEWVPDEYL